MKLKNIELLTPGLFFFLTCFSWPQSLPASENQWTRFLGPNGSGISSDTTIPGKWTEKDYNWKIKLPGKGHSSPVIWGNKIFLSCAEKKPAKIIILCLKTIDGSVLWKREYISNSHHVNRDNSYASSTPAVDKDRVYFYWTTPEKITLLALTHDGKEAWQRNLGPFVSMHGSATSPIVYKDMVIVGNDQKGKSCLYALDSATGMNRWKTGRRSSVAAYSTPRVYSPENGPPELIFTSTSHGITSIDPITGAQNWEYTDAFPLRVVSSPVISGNIILCTCGQGGRGVKLTAVRAGSKEKNKPPELAYTLKRDLPYVPTSLAKDGLIFMLADSGYVTCFKAATGKTIWKERLPARFYSSFVCAGDRLYTISKKGTVFVLAASEKYKLISSIPIGEGSFASPAIADGVMYLRTFSTLFSIGGKK